MLSNSKAGNTCEDKKKKQGVPVLRILKGKKHPKIKLQRLRKVRTWAFGSLVHQINSF